VSTEDYRRAFDAAVREYERLSAEHEATARRLGQLQESIRTLSKLCGYEPTVPLGLTDACRLVLRSASKPMTAPEVRDRLQAIGLDLDKYANGLGAVHTVLKRLTESGHLEALPHDETARTAYALLSSGIFPSRISTPRTSTPATSSRRRSKAKR